MLLRQVLLKSFQCEMLAYETILKTKKWSQDGSVSIQSAVVVVVSHLRQKFE